ncbi:dienelactone hydrolase family protein [Methylovirgula sp. 4M-Z18]|uniref:dienelactone hydrolase family protein n=1 Tax=Methylovirgula sp. 4M-Z18 TaxID=2293567 RepID=UPI000E2F01EE|nr:dienelactone hydrolase family protein [Methylovirgula sp. 4M-Z18]RFB80303.1 carboxymethylenebutenolidase [Methylovirgula sp. 4M-Z18]
MTQIDQLEPVDNARRTLVTGSLAAGFALAVQPVAAATIVTDSSGLTDGMVTITSADMQLPAYRAYPAGNVHAPVILVVQEIFGLHEHIKDICRRLAKAGYYAIAPDLYVREGDATKADMQTIVQTIVPKVADAQVLGDLDSSVRFAKEEGADTDRLGVTGFCWGGRIVWLYAAHNAALKAAVAWYGRVAGNTTSLQPKNPIDIAADLHAPVLGLYGGADQSIPVETLDAMKKAADAAGKKTEFVVYPDTPHAFNADYRPSYREGPAKDGWAKMLAWFKDNGL